MAKGLRAACKRRWRAVKRQVVLSTVERERMQTLHQHVHSLLQGEDISLATVSPLNAFLHPDSHGAVFPQQKPGPAPLDFRCEKLGILAGLAGSHNRRIYTAAEEQEFMQQYGHLPGKTEDPRTFQLRRAAADEGKKESCCCNMHAEEDAAAADEEANMELGCIDPTAAAAPAAAHLKNQSCSSNSMMLTPEMEKMIEQRRKKECAKVPVKVDKLKAQRGGQKKVSVQKRRKGTAARRR